MNDHSQHLAQQDLGHGASVEVFNGGFVTVTGNRLGESSGIVCADPQEVWSCCKRANRSELLESEGRNNALARYAGTLTKKGLSSDETLTLVLAKNGEFSEPLSEDEIRNTIAKSISKWAHPSAEINPDTWRDACKTVRQLSQEPVR